MIEQAQAEWVIARKNWLASGDEEVAEAFFKAERKLLAAFSLGLRCDNRVLMNAYNIYRDLLIRQTMPYRAMAIWSRSAIPS